MLPSLRRVECCTTRRRARTRGPGGVVQQRTVGPSPYPILPTASLLGPVKTEFRYSDRLSLATTGPFTLMMKFAQIAVLAAILVVSAQAISCNVGASTGSCSPADLPAADSCTRCVRSIGISTSACSTTTAIDAFKCTSQQTACTTGSSAGTFTTCQTANCNSCSKASATHVPVFLLLAASVITLCF